MFNTSKKLIAVTVLGSLISCTNAVENSFEAPVISMGTGSANMSVFLPPVLSFAAPVRGQSIGADNSVGFVMSTPVLNSPVVVNEEPVPPVTPPTEPTVPPTTEPEQPAEPVQPAEPAEPETPAVPETPEVPEEPVAPAPVVFSNPAIEASVFTTAFDRAVEFRDVVRMNSVNGHNLWIVANGSKTRVNGAKTYANGVTFGADTTVANTTIGFAATAGNGHTNAIRKDDFQWYGLGIYGKTTMTYADLMVDASVINLKSDVANAARFTTTVWSMGAELSKTFDVASATVTPFVGFDAYRMIGHGKANVAESSATTAELPVGIKAAKTFKMNNGMTITPNVKAAAVKTLGTKTISSTAFAADESLSIKTAFTDSVKGVVEAEVAVTHGNFGLNLKGTYARGNNDHSVASYTAKACYAF